MTGTPKRASRTVARTILLGFASIFALLVLAVLIFPAPIIEIAAVNVLNARGFGPARISVAKIATDGVDVRDISLLGGAVRASRLAADFDFAQLRRGRIDRILLEGLDGTLDWDTDGPRIGEFKLTGRAPSGDPPGGDPPGGAPDTRNVDDSTSDTGTSIANIVVKDARIVFRLPDRDVALRVDTDLNAFQNGWRGSLIAFASGQGVTVDASWGGFAAGSDITDWRGQGNLKLSFDGLAVPGLTDALAGDGTIDLTAHDQGIAVVGSFPRPLDVELSRERVGPIVPIFPGLADDPRITFEIAGTAQPDFKIELNRAQSVPRWNIDTKATAHIGHTAASAAVNGWIDAPSGNPMAIDFAFDLISLGIDGLNTSGGTVSAGITLRDNRGPLVMAEGAFALDGKATGLNLPNLSLPAGDISGRGTWRLDGLSMSFDLSELNARGDRLELPDIAAVDPALTIGLKSGTAPQQVNVVFGDAITVAGQLALDVAPFNIMTAALAEPVSVAVPSVSVEGYATPADGIYRVSIGHDGGTVSYGDEVKLEPHLDLVLSNTDTSGNIGGRVKLSKSGQPQGPFAAPARAEFNVTSRFTMSGEAINASGDLAAGNGKAFGHFDLSRNQQTGHSIAVDIPEIKFGIGGANWQDIAGTLLPIDRVDGKISASARLKSSDTGYAGTGQVKFENVDFELDTIPIQSLDGTLAFEQIWPPKTPGLQTIKAGAVAVTPPLTEIVADIDMPGDGTLVLSSLAAGYAGGSIHGGPAPIDLTGKPSTVVLNIDGAKVDALLAATGTTGLAGSGTIAGAIPLEVRDGGLFVVDGKLEGRGGTVAYRPSEAPAALAGGGDIVLQALSDFHFDAIKATINGNVLEDLNVAVGLKGKNPGLYGGYPIEFNLNLDGPLARIASDGMAGYRIPDDIKRKLEQNAVSGK
ncbi:MAG: YdbH domain-containing protein [Rhodobacteraceae bacterium]|nr:YdbH domain-containing protein [Paracoccaceae bacterium]